MNDLKPALWSEQMRSEANLTDTNMKKTSESTRNSADLGRAKRPNQPAPRMRQLYERYLMSLLLEARTIELLSEHMLLHRKAP
jgi:hypothetical protein